MFRSPENKERKEEIIFARFCFYLSAGDFNAVYFGFVFFGLGLFSTFVCRMFFWNSTVLKRDSRLNILG